jgi:hypothetical protein
VHDQNIKLPIGGVDAPAQGGFSDAVRIVVRDETRPYNTHASRVPHPASRNTQHSAPSTQRSLPHPERQHLVRP